LGIPVFPREPGIKKGTIAVQYPSADQKKDLPGLPQENALVRDGVGLAVPLLRLREKDLKAQHRFGCSEGHGVRVQ
jgi:hypothetical protein